MNVRRSIIACGLILTAVTGTRAGEVELTDGRTVWGDVTLSADGAVKVAVSGQAAQSFQFDAIARALVTPASPDVAKTTATAGLPWPWQAKDVGNVSAPGQVTMDNNAFAVKAAGWGVWSGVDSFHFISQPLIGDGQVIARVTLPESASSSAVGSVMIRESMEINSPFVATALGPKGAARLQARPWPIPKDQQRQDPAAVVERVASSWVRISRAGDTFTAYRSDDGRSWEEIGSQQMKMKPTAFVGLATSSTLNAVAGPVRFDRVAVILGPPASTAAASPLPPIGLVLADGTARPGTVTAISADAVAFTGGDGKPQSLPLEDVAWIFTQPTFANLAARATQGTAGALLRTGDFLDGESIALADGKLTVTSTVFGPKTFDLATEVVAIALREPANWAGQWHVRDKSGTVVSGDAVRVEEDSLTVGTGKVALTDVREIYAPIPKP